jgi:hypothetical protein
MQFKCYNCHTTVSVPPHGGQFQCPNCRAINIVTAPITAPPTAPSTRPAKLVAGTVAVLAVGALIAGWWGVGVGVLTLIWAIAGALGKLKGPLELAFPHSTHRLALTLGSLVMAGLVTTCGVMGVVGQREKARQEALVVQQREVATAEAKAAQARRESDAAAAKAAHDQQLRARVGTIAAEAAAVLSSVEALIAAEQWQEAEAKLSQLGGTLAEYRAFDPILDEMRVPIQRYDELFAHLDSHRRESELAVWIERAQLVVADPIKCEDQTEVEQLRAQQTQPPDGHASRAEFERLRAGLDVCQVNMPPPSQWQYRASEDPMGGVTAVAQVESANDFEFDFPYQGRQHATLVLRNDGGYDVMLVIERGQFVCTFGCSVQVRFDDGEAQRWRATEPSDYDTTILFLRNESKFIKQLRKAKTVRIAADFFQEGTRVLEFPVARFEPGRLE